MRGLKGILAVLGVTSVIGLAGPASADPIGPFTVSNVTIYPGVYGEGASSTSGPVSSISYGGAIGLTIGGDSNASLLDGNYVVLCDDLLHDIGVGSSNTPFYALESPSSVFSYLSPAGLTNSQDILGLSAYFTAKYTTLSAEQDAAIQVAIWELEYSSLKVNVPLSLQTAANGYLAAAAGYYAIAEGGTTPWKFYQLVDPGTSGIVPSDLPTKITYQTNGQVQGQLIAIPGSNTFGFPTPEPLTISVFGAGLVGAAVLRRRKKKAT